MEWIVKPSGAVACPVFNQASYFPINNIYCVGRNYREHSIEMGSNPDREPPFFFQKSSEVLLLPGNDLDYPQDTIDLHYEVELVVAISKDCFRLNKESVESVIFGYAVGIDLTKRDIQEKAKQSGKPWLSAKVFYQSAAISKILIKDESLEPKKLEISLEVNDVLRQKSSCDKMIWSVNEIIFLLSQKIPLRAGDLIYTGTPAGVDKLEKGDFVSAILHQEPIVDIKFHVR